MSVSDSARLHAKGEIIVKKPICARFRRMAQRISRSQIFSRRQCRNIIVGSLKQMKQSVLATFLLARCYNIAAASARRESSKCLQPAGNKHQARRAAWRMKIRAYGYVSEIILRE